MRQIENAQRLSYNLIHDIIVSAVQSRTIQSGQSRILRRTDIFSFIHTAQRQQFVPLESYVCVDIQLHVLGSQGCDTDGEFRSTIPHGSQISQKFVISKRRYTDIIHIQHIPCFGEIIVHRQQQAVPVKSHVHPRIESRLDFPFQIRIDVFQALIRHQRRISHGSYPVRTHQCHSGIRINPSLISCQSVSQSQLQVINQVKTSHKLLTGYIPRSRNRREYAPFMIPSKFGRCIRTQVHRQHVTVVVRIIHTSQERHQMRLFIIGTSTFPRTQCPALQAVIPQLIGRKISRGRVKAVKTILFHLP